MPEKFQNKYAIKSTRLKNHNYTQNGLYFVTICTQDKEYIFGYMDCYAESFAHNY